MLIPPKFLRRSTVVHGKSRSILQQLLSLHSRAFQRGFSSLYVAALSAPFRWAWLRVHSSFILAPGMGHIAYQVHSVLRHYVSLIFSSRASKGSFSHLILHHGVYQKCGGLLLRDLFTKHIVPSRTTLLLQLLLSSQRPISKLENCNGHFSHAVKFLN